MAIDMGIEILRGVSTTYHSTRRSNTVHGGLMNNA